MKLTRENWTGDQYYKRCTLSFTGLQFATSCKLEKAPIGLHKEINHSIIKVTNTRSDNKIKENYIQREREREREIYVESEID